jgi:hypothetical protein
MDAVTDSEVDKYYTGSVRFLHMFNKLCALISFLTKLILRSWCCRFQELGLEGDQVPTRACHSDLPQTSRILIVDSCAHGMPYPSCITRYYPLDCYCFLWWPNATTHQWRCVRLPWRVIRPTSSCKTSCHYPGKPTPGFLYAILQAYNVTQ